jgi:hypothetical protein
LTEPVPALCGQCLWVVVLDEGKGPRLTLAEFRVRLDRREELGDVLVFSFHRGTFGLEFCSDPLGDHGLQ